MRQSALTGALGRAGEMGKERVPRVERPVGAPIAALMQWVIGQGLGGCNRSLGRAGEMGGGQGVQQVLRNKLLRGSQKWLLLFEQSRLLLDQDKFIGNPFIDIALWRPCYLSHFFQQLVENLRVVSVEFDYNFHF
jgi:hypothetical protein